MTLSIKKSHVSRSTGTALTLAAIGALVAAACSTDEKSGENPSTDAGSDASGGGAGGGGAGGGAGAGGSGGSGGSGGNGGSGGAPEAGADADADADALDACVPDTTSAVDAGLLPSATGTGILLLSATDYFSGTEIAVVDLATNAVTRHVTVTDSDAVPYANGGRGFIIARSSGILHVLGPTGDIARSIDLGDAVPAPGDAGSDAGDAGDAGAPPAPYSLNPHAVVVVPGSSPAKAYVSLYAANRIAVVDLDAGTVTGSVDLSSFLVGTDADGSVDANGGVFSDGRVSFVLDRIDQWTITAPDYLLACETPTGLVVSIDPATDQLVGVDGGAATPLQLGLTSSSASTLDPADGALLVLQAGCYTGTVRSRLGIEAVDLAVGATQTIFTPASDDYLGDLLLLGGGDALVQTSDANFVSTWRSWTRAQAAFGAAVQGIPDSPVADANDEVLGISTDPCSGTQNVVRVRVGGTTTRRLLTGLSWNNAGFTSLGGAALVRP